MAALWRVGLQRMRADWPIVAAAWLITILSAVLFAAGVIYPSAAAEAGLQRALRDASVASRSLVVSRYDDASAADEVDAQVMAALQDTLSGTGGSVGRDWRGSATFSLVPATGEPTGDQVELGFLDGLADHAMLVAGAWPADTSPGTLATPEVAVAEPAAAALGLTVGDDIDVLVHHGSQTSSLQLRVTALYAVADPAEAWWGEDEQLQTGLRDNGRYRTYGPFLATRYAFTAVLGEDGSFLRWRVYPDFDRLAVDEASRFATRIDAIASRLLVDSGRQFTVDTTLPDILRAADRSLLVSRASVILLMVQLALLAGYAIVLMATLLVDHRRVDTALLRARGASSGHVALLALAEASVLAVTAVAVAPTIASAAVGLFNRVGPLADVGLQLGPDVTPGAYVAAAGAGLLCVLLLVLPAILAARAFAQEQGARSRQETRTIGQRLGLDIVLLAVTGIAMWQLRLYGAPLTRSVQGELGLDPLLVAAPAIGLVAGGVLALRILPLVAQLLEATVARGRGLLVALGARQLARRPLRYTRSALLLVLAVSMGVFALSYSATWAGSQRDQAAYQAGADIRLPAASVDAGISAETLGGALETLPEVASVTPVERIPDGVKFATSGSSDLLALDAGTAQDIALLRSDATEAGFGALLAPLIDGRPAPVLAAVPDGTAVLRVTPEASMTTIVQYGYDPETDTDTVVILDPAKVPVQLRAVVAVRDGHGLIHQFRSSLETMLGADTSLFVELALPGNAAASPSLSAPLAVVAASIEVWLEEGVDARAATFGINAIAAGPTAGGPWAEMSLAGSGPWSAAMGRAREGSESLPDSIVRGLTVQLAGGDSDPSVFGLGRGQPSAVFGFLPNGIDGTGGALPVIANRAFLESFGITVGDTVSATVAGRFSTLAVTGAMDSFPTTNPQRPLVIADEATIGLLRLRTTVPTRPVDEWWIAAQPGTADTLAARLAAAPFARPQLVSAAGRSRTLSTDPVALGIIGALTLGFVTTGLFAIIGLAVSAGVSARQQRTEFALLRALGLSSRQLAGSLWLEHGSVAILGLGAGTGLGLLISWLVLPFVTVTQGGRNPVPPVRIDVPWDRVLVLDLLSALALGLAVLVIGAALRQLRVGATLRMGED
jgi:hypothetical protein